MRVIAKKRFDEAALKFPNNATALAAAYKKLKKERFDSPDDLRKVFPSLDNFKNKDKWWVIDIGGNDLRLIAFIEFRNGTLFVKHIVSHAEYDKLCKRYAKEAK